MSPETDRNPEPLAIETPAGEPAANSSAAQAQSASGAATAVARAQEPPNPIAAAVESDASEAPGANQSPISQDEHAGVGAAEGAPEAARSETNSLAETSEATETTEPTETMDQLLDQFSTPQPASEGEIFDGRVLAVTDAGVVVDVGGKFEGLVPAQEFLDSGNPIEFGAGQTIEVERLHERKDGYVLLSYVRAHRRRVWERIEKSYREHTNVTGKNGGTDQGRPGGGYRRARVSCPLRRSSCVRCTIWKRGRIAKSKCAS